jgi:hypothetical protein
VIVFLMLLVLLINYQKAESVLKALDEAWLSVKPFASKYYH